MSVSPQTPLHISKVRKAHVISLLDFVLAWGIPLSILSERLRQQGYVGMDIECIRSIKAGQALDERQYYLLQVALMEMRNDIDKTLGSLRKLSKTKHTK